MPYSLEQFRADVRGKNIDPHLMNVIIHEVVEGATIDEIEKGVVVVLKDTESLPLLEQLVAIDTYGVNGPFISVHATPVLLATILNQTYVERIGF